MGLISNDDVAAFHNKNGSRATEMSNLIQTLELSMLTTTCNFINCALYLFNATRGGRIVVGVGVRGVAPRLSFALRLPTAVDCVGLLVSFNIP